MLAYYKYKPVLKKELSSVIQVYSDIKSEISRYGVKCKILYNSLFVFFLLVT